MKHNFLLTFLSAWFLLFSGTAVIPASAQEYIKENYCNQTVGLELRYSNLDKNGKLEGYFTQKMALCKGTLQNGHFSYDQYFYKKDGSPLLKDNYVRMDAVMTDKGPTESTMNGMSKVMKTQNLMTKGDVSTIPPVLKTGMQLPDSEVKLHIDSFNCSLYTSDRKVEGSAQLTTPAGTFDCFIITETQKMKTLGTQTEKLKTWYAKGIGVVRQEFRNKKGEPVRAMELVSLSVK